MVSAIPTSAIGQVTTSPGGVKTATPDIIQFDDTTIIDNAEVVVDLLFENIEDKSTFYFVHKYECITEDRNNLIANIDYSKKIDSVINFNNIYGTQFHPEKSQKTGIKLIHNLIQISE